MPDKSVPAKVMIDPFGMVQKLMTESEFREILDSIDFKSPESLLMKILKMEKEEQLENFESMTQEQAETLFTEISEQLLDIVLKGDESYLETYAVMFNTYIFWGLLLYADWNLSIEKTV